MHRKIIKGKFIVIEGLEGSGKTTAKDTVVQVLLQYGINDIVQTREPGGTLVAEKLRELIKENIDTDPITDKAEVLMLYAARIQLIEKIIKPALARGALVVGDRHDLSSQAYQGGGRGIDRKWMTSLRDILLGSFRPDLTLYLDISPEKGLDRVRLRGGSLDRIEQESLAFFKRVHKCYLTLVSGDSSIKTIRAEQPLVKVSNEIQREIKKWLEINRFVIK